MVRFSSLAFVICIKLAANYLKAAALLIITSWDNPAASLVKQLRNHFSHFYVQTAQSHMVMKKNTNLCHVSKSMVTFKTPDFLTSVRVQKNSSNTNMRTVKGRFVISINVINPWKLSKVIWSSVIMCQYQNIHVTSRGVRKSVWPPQCNTMKKRCSITKKRQKVTLSNLDYIP